MDIVFTITIGIALSMDCLAVASCYGMQAPKDKRLMFELGIWFGTFQIIMILLGNLIGGVIVTLIYRYAKIIAILLLLLISAKMIIEGIRGEKSHFETNRLRIIYLSFATSIDALLVGLAYSMIRENILPAAVIVGIVCFFITIAGFIIGGFINRYVDRWAQFLGALVLIIIAIKISLE